MLKTRGWIALLCGLFLVFLLALCLRRPASGPVTTAQIYVDGVLVRSVDLDAVETEERFTVEGGGGVNEICVQPGQIRVEEADCPDQICVLQGWISSPEDLPLVCLPHGLLIEIADTEP